MKIFSKKELLLYMTTCALFTLSKKEEYIEKVSANGTENRPDNLPIYQAEQLKIEDEYFYSLKHFNDDLKKVPYSP